MVIISYSAFFSNYYSKNIYLFVKYISVFLTKIIIKF